MSARDKRYTVVGRYRGRRGHIARLQRLRGQIQRGPPPQAESRVKEVVTLTKRGREGTVALQSFLAGL
ncbi:hypothetical protein [Thermoproteus tenax]|uniref:hypothetical protein n=1 Tax=Thermoproteus tenax TaxID=2271 RepID=UPI0014330AC6|nr:hypothetical protein [Thermoproteus tenax]